MNILVAPAHPSLRDQHRDLARLLAFCGHQLAPADAASVDALVLLGHEAEEARQARMAAVALALAAAPVIVVGYPMELREIAMARLERFGLRWATSPAEVPALLEPWAWSPEADLPW
jgi:hypothetical protein